MTKEMTSSFVPKKDIQLKNAEPVAFLRRTLPVGDYALKGHRASRVIYRNLKIIQSAMNRNDTPFQSLAASTHSYIDKYRNVDTAVGSFLASNSKSNTETILERVFKALSSLAPPQFSRCLLSRSSTNVCSEKRRNTDEQLVLGHLVEEHDSNWRQRKGFVDDAQKPTTATKMGAGECSWLNPLC